jgi:hypothetical protein
MGVPYMNKYLMLSAAAVVASATGASADTHTFQFGTAGGGSYCDGGTVTNNGVVWAWQHTNNNCYSGVSTGQGLLGKVEGFGKVANMSDNYFGAATSIALNYTLPKKIKAGNTWYLWVEFSGTSSFLGNSGVLINTTAAKKGGANTVAKLKSMIKAHQNAKHS